MGIDLPRTKPRRDTVPFMCPQTYYPCYVPNPGTKGNTLIRIIPSSSIMYAVALVL